MDKQQSKKRAKEGKYLLEIIRCLRYLGWQGIALQDHDGNDNYFAYSVHTTNLFYITLKRKLGRHKYMYNGAQNRILNIVAVLALQEKLKTIPGQRCFSKIDDKGTDASNKEQLSFCLRGVDENLNAFEDVISLEITSWKLLKAIQWT